MQHFTEQDIKWLAELLEAEDLEEIEVQTGDESVVVSRKIASPPPPAPSPQASLAGPLAVSEDTIPVLAPMTGVFYRAPSPNAPPYVEVGDRVEGGDVVGLIEAMKMFNEVAAPAGGVIAHILVDNEQSVEADQPLMFIKLSPD